VARIAQDVARDREAVLVARRERGREVKAKYAMGRPLRSIQPIHQCTGSRTAPVVPVFA
jgi:hypothetical protein